jgi:hypothetical protein
VRVTPVENRGLVTPPHGISSTGRISTQSRLVIKLMIFTTTVEILPVELIPSHQAPIFYSGRARQTEPRTAIRTVNILGGPPASSNGEAVC